MRTAGSFRQGWRSEEILARVLVVMPPGLAVTAEARGIRVNVPYAGGCAGAAQNDGRELIGGMARRNS